MNVLQTNLHDLTVIIVDLALGWGLAAIFAYAFVGWLSECLTSKARWQWRRKRASGEPL